MKLFWFIFQSLVCRTTYIIIILLSEDDMPPDLLSDANIAS